MFTALGAPIQAQQATAELSRLGGRRAVTGGLTPAEARIAGLVGAGQTNSEVAATLFMSVRTVESHLGRIYRKLGVRSRTELVAPRPTRSARRLTGICRAICGQSCVVPPTRSGAAAT